ncbi:hypothetical protein EYF80_011065 [Liparis tanakae]|uniref:Uncharacterized protein n=1 Tax=Liparis tanakae TaxID=230148 RepID=A0A4Z2ILJ2_9TELE|nr:hypothetical protein EYF80_011065 [Liparis tanakae]
MKKYEMCRRKMSSQVIFIVIFTTPSSLPILPLPRSPPPSRPEGSLEVAPLNTEAGAQKHRVLMLR